MRAVFLCLLLSLGTHVYASQKVQVKASGSGSSSSSTLSYFYGGDEAESIWSTDISLTSTRSKVEGTGVEDEVTRDLQWVNSWDLKYNWFIDLGVGGTNTKVNKIKTTNADVTFGRVSENFYQFNWDLTLGLNSIRQEESTVPSGRRLALMQKKIGLQLGFDPLDWLNLSLFTAKYSYNRDVDLALLLLESQAAMSAYGTAFGDELSTLIDQETGLALGFRFNEKTRLNLTFSQSQDAPTPHVRGSRVSALTSYRWNSAWDGSFSLSSSRFEATSTTPESKYSYAGLGVGYSW